MLMSQTLRRPLTLLLVAAVAVAGMCLRVHGTPVQVHAPRRHDSPAALQDVTLAAADAASVSGGPTHATGPPDVDGSAGGGGGGGGGGRGGGGSDGPDGRGAAPGETHGERNGDIVRGGRSKPGVDAGGGRETGLGRERREAEGEGESEESPSVPGEDQSGPTPHAAPPLDPERTTSGASAPEVNATAAPASPEDGRETAGAADTPGSALPASTAPGAPPGADARDQRSAAWERGPTPGGPWPSSRGPGGPAPIPSGAPSPGATPFPAAPPEWAPAPAVPDLLLAEVGADAMPRPEGPESLWAEAARDSEVDTAAPPSQDQTTEGTMSSKVLPLIFDPFDDVTSQGPATDTAASASAGVTAEPGSPRPQLAATATGATFPSEAPFERLVTAETDGDGPSHPPPILVPEWMSPWQTSGTELLETGASPGPVAPPSPGPAAPPPGPAAPPSPGPAAPPSGPAEHQAVNDSDKEEKLEETFSIPGVPASSVLSSGLPVTTATHRHMPNSTSGLEERESEEESDEDDSEEEQTSTPASNRPPYSLISPPPVWVQQNQGLMRSWMELIREKAGYVSGMLVPVGIGIAGAILIVGALNSIRMIHRRRRNSFKYQRRKVRQQEQPRETGPGRPDQAMLLADSSEDEF